MAICCDSFPSRSGATDRPDLGVSMARFSPHLREIPALCLDVWIDPDCVAVADCKNGTSMRGHPAPEDPTAEKISHSDDDPVPHPASPSGPRNPIAIVSPAEDKENIDPRGGAKICSDLRLKTPRIACNNLSARRKPLQDITAFMESSQVNNTLSSKMHQNVSDLVQSLQDLQLQNHRKISTKASQSLRRQFR